MNKGLLVSILISAIVVNNFAFSQNIEYSYQLKNTVDIKELYKSGNGEFKITYYRSGDFIIRHENDKIQLINQKFEQIWEYEIPLIEGYGNNNYYKIGFDSEYIYILSYNVVVKAENSESKLTRIDYSGNSTTIDFNTIFKLRSAYALEVIDGDLYVVAARATGTVNPYMNTVETSAHIICLDSDLKQKNKVIDLPYYEENSDNNLLWEYNGIRDGMFTFFCGYHRSKNGKPSSDIKDSFFYEEFSIGIDFQNVIHKRERRNGEKLSYIIPDKYDPKRWQITTDSGFSNLRGTIHQMRTSKLFIEGDGIKSQDLIQEIYQLSLTGKKKVEPYFEKYLIDDIVYDPINDNIIVSFRTVTLGNQYLAYLNSDLKPVKIHSFIALLPSSIVPSQQNFSLDIKECLETWESPENKLIKSGFDLAMSKADKSQFTFLNYDDYQIVFHDNFYTNQTWGFKVVR